MASIPNCAIDNAGLWLESPAVVLERPAALAETSVPLLHRWQARCGEIFTVRSGDDFFRARLLDLPSAMVQPFAQVVSPELAAEMILFQAFPARERFELIVQKAVELGASRIIPFTSRHSSDPAERALRQDKSSSWSRIILRAARQCRCWRLPLLSPVLSWEQLMDEVQSCDLLCVFHPVQDEKSLLQRLRGGFPDRLGLLVGPEGGLNQEEVAQLLASGGKLTSLGNRILRTETAAISALSIAAAGINLAHLKMREE